MATLHAAPSVLVEEATTIEAPTIDEPTNDATTDTPTDNALQAVNPATVPQRSPLRYPGGKTWLVPFVHKWLEHRRGTANELVEPFAGGAIVGLTAAYEELVPAVTLVEMDPDVAALWRTVFYGDGVGLAERYASFTPTPETVKAVLDAENRSLADRAFVTLMRNRVSRGGILAPGAGVLKKGENGKGMASRWYPDTIRRRILDLVSIRDRIRFIQGDGISLMEANGRRTDAVWFIDPPYTVAGKRLYSLSDMDHEYLFHVTSTLAGDFVMTYDESPEIEAFANRHEFQIRRVKMKTTHHNQKYEFIIGRDLSWLDSLD